ncbi:Transmembrane protein 82, partial [Chaetura pelagica]
SDPERQAEAGALRAQRRGLELLRVLVLMGVLAMVGPRVAALVVLEFSLRAVSTLLSLGKVRLDEGGKLRHGGAVCVCGGHCIPRQVCSRRGGCGEETVPGSAAAHPSPCVCNTPGEDGGGSVERTRKALQPHLPCRARYCGLCLLLLASGHGLPRLLRTALALTFAVAGLAAVALINRDFLSTAEAVRFWTPLTICYTLLVVYMQEGPRQSVYQTVLVRMGGLFILLLTVGRWADVLHVLLSLLGEFWCLLHTRVMLESCRRQ